jgi:hypothetical protein
MEANVLPLENETTLDTMNLFVVTEVQDTWR